MSIEETIKGLQIDLMSNEDLIAELENCNNALSGPGGLLHRESDEIFDPDLYQKSIHKWTTKKNVIETEIIVRKIIT